GTLPESFSQNVRNVLDLTNTAGEFKRLFEASERMERILSLQPIGICRIDIKNIGRNRRNLPTISKLASALEQCAVLFNRDVLHQVFAILEYECIQIDQGSDPIWNAVRHSGHHASAIGMSTQHNARQFLPPDQVDHI